MNKTLSRILVLLVVASGLGAAWYVKSRNAAPPPAPVVVEMVYELAPGDVYPVVVSNILRFSKLSSSSRLVRGRRGLRAFGRVPPPREAPAAALGKPPS